MPIRPRWLLLLLPLLFTTPAFAASGDRIDIKSFKDFFQTTWLMLDAETSTTDGVWVDYEGFSLASLAVDSIAGGAVVDVRGSNDLTMPATSAHGFQIGSNITADGVTIISGPYRFIKTRVTTSGSGSISAKLTATSSGGGGGAGSVAGTVTANAGTGTFTTAGAKSNNAAAPGATNVGALTHIANAAAPSYTEGNMVAPTTNLGGASRVYVPDVGETNHRKLSTASTNATSVTSVNTIVTGIDCQNPSATTAAYLHMYNKATAPSPATDTALVIGTWDIGAASAAGQRGGFVKEFVNGLGGLTDGLGYTITGNKDDTQTTNAVADVRCNIQYHQKAS